MGGVSESYNVDLGRLAQCGDKRKMIRARDIAAQKEIDRGMTIRRDLKISKFKGERHKQSNKQRVLRLAWRRRKDVSHYGSGGGLIPMTGGGRGVIAGENGGRKKRHLSWTISCSNDIKEKCS